jgi:hypothetical protein
MTIVFMPEINNNKKRKVFEILSDGYLHVNLIPWIPNECMKVFINQLRLINNIIHHLILLAVIIQNYFYFKLIFFFYLASSVPVDNSGLNEMSESTTGTLLSLGKTEFDRRIKKKYVQRFEFENILNFLNKFRQELLEDAIQNNRPFPTWDGATVVAWLEVCTQLIRKLIDLFVL